MQTLQVSDLEVVRVRDPRIILDNKRVFSCLESGLDIRYKNWVATSWNNSTLNFITQPSDANTITDRMISLSAGMRVLITATVQPGFSVLQPNADAPRNLPLHSLLNNIIISCNNTNFSQQIAEMVHPLQRYDVPENVRAIDQSSAPTALDNCQNYFDVLNENSNPLAADGNVFQDNIKPRGGFAWTVVYNETNNTPTPQTMYAVYDLISTEMIQLSPLVWGKLFPHSSGLYNVTALTWALNVLQNSGFRVHSHANIPIGNSAPFDYSRVVYQSNITNVDVLFTALDGVGSLPIAPVGGFSYPSYMTPVLNITSITPPKDLSNALGPQRSISWDFYSLINYPKDQGTSIAYGDVKLLKTDNIQLPSVPRYIYLFTRPTLADYYNSSVITESYYSIEGLNITFGNRTGILSEANKQQLWQIARKNGCSIPYVDFAGELKYTVGGNAFNNNTRYAGCGAVLRLELGTDIPLPPEVSVSSTGQYTLQVNVFAKNINPRTAAYNAITNPFPVYNPYVTLNCICVYDGVVTIPGSGKIIPQTGVLSPGYVINASNTPYVSYEEVRDVHGGLSFSGLKNMTNKALSAAKNANDYLRKNKTISRVSQGVSDVANLPFVRDLPYAQNVSGLASDISRTASYLGYGKGRRRGRRGGDVLGGDVVGAGRVDPDELLERVNNDIYSRLRRD